MSAHAAALEGFAERLRGFLRDPRCRLLHVVCAADLRKGVLATAMAAEHAEDNRAPFVAFDAPHGADSPGWLARTRAAREQHAARREGADPPIPELPPPPPGDDARVVFAQQLWQLVEHRPPGSEGLVAVLAPTSVEAPKHWAEGVGLLVGGRRLADVRWIVIDLEGSTISPVVAGLGARAVQYDARISAADRFAAVEDMIAGHGGAAPKGVVPPPRPDVPQGDPSPDDQRRLAIGRKSLAAALAMGRGQAVEGVAAQRDARDLAAAAGWTDEAMQMDLVLGGQLMSAGQGRAAEESFARTIEGARKAGADSTVATAGFALGAARAARREQHTALVAWAEAALAAERSGDAMLAIEGNRLAGQAAADLKMEPQAITFLSRAVKLTEAAPPERLASSTASDAARSLAKICRKRGLRARAVELEAQAEALARPVTPPPKPTPPVAAAPVPEPPAPEPPAPEPPAAEPPAPQPAAAEPAAPEPASPAPVSPATATPAPVPAFVPRVAAPPPEPAAPEPPPLAASAPAPPAYVRLPTPQAPEMLDPAELLGPLPVPPEQVHNLPEHSVLLRRDARMLAYEPPPEGTVLLDDLPVARPPAAAGPAEGTMLLDDRPELAPPAPVDFGEGTGLMTLEEIAQMHWGGETPTAAPDPSQARRWTRDEIQILQKAVVEALEPEATLLLSLDELAALRGEKVDRPPAPAPARPEPAAASGEIGGLEPMPPTPEAPAPAAARPAPPEIPDGLEPIPGLEPLPPAEAPPSKPSKTFDADEVTMLTLDDIARMREAMRTKKDPKDPKDPKD